MGGGGKEAAYTFSLFLLIGEVNQVQPRSHPIGWTDQGSVKGGRLVSYTLPSLILLEKLLSNIIGIYFVNSILWPITIQQAQFNRVYTLGSGPTCIR